MEIKCTDPRLSYERGTGWRLSLLVDTDDVTPLEDAIKPGELRVTISKWSNRRSLSANAYFHVLCGKIADKTHGSLDDVKEQMVLRYGALARNEDNTTVGVMLPAGKDPKSIGLKYTRWFGDKKVNSRGVELRFCCYLVYDETHKYTAEQMGRLIDGTIDEAHDLNIETMKPAEVAWMVERWGKDNDA